MSGDAQVTVSLTCQLSGSISLSPVESMACREAGTGWGRPAGAGWEWAVQKARNNVQKSVQKTRKECVRIELSRLSQTRQLDQGLDGSDLSLSSWRCGCLVSKCASSQPSGGLPANFLATTPGHSLPLCCSCLRTTVPDHSIRRSFSASACYKGRKRKGNRTAIGRES